MTTFWITKYALSQGISEHAEHSSFVGHSAKYNGLVVVVWDGFPGYANFHGEGNEWHRTREGAVARAEEMRKAKIASLHKQIAKLEKMKFD